MRENENSSVKEKTQSKIPSWAIWAGALLVVFLLGFVPMWLQYRGANQTTETVQKQLRKAELKNQLTTAIVEAGNGEYETARQKASDFFTSLNTEIEKGENGSLSAEQIQKLKPIFTNRDDIITLLAQRDPASVERLRDVYAIYKQALGETQKQSAAPVS